MPLHAEAAWQPSVPMEVFGKTLQPDAAWFHVFIETWILLTHGQDDDDDTSALCVLLYTRNYMRDPAVVAREVHQRHLDASASASTAED